MPLTVYSIPNEKELDVEQLVEQYAKRDGIPVPASLDQIPDSWRPDMRIQLECPCCFVTGAELVRNGVSKKTDGTVRQACFRFVTPGHHPQCDYAANDKAGFTPPNLVQFGANKSAITRAVRELVCSAIHTKVFDQKTIRDMREWFFNKKLEASFAVSLDPRVPVWLDGIWRAASFVDYTLPEGVSMSDEIASLPDFDWRVEAKKILHSRHAETLTKIKIGQLWRAYGNKQVAALAKRHGGDVVFDPSVLKPQYDLSIALAKFMSHNYAPLKAAVRNAKVGVADHVLAFSALLLFVHDWNIADAVSAFVSIVAAIPQANQSLGNVIGLNPFYDFDAWQGLKLLQEQQIVLPENDAIQSELKEIEQELRQRFNATLPT